MPEKKRASAPYSSSASHANRSADAETCPTASVMSSGLGCIEGQEVRLVQGPLLHKWRCLHTSGGRQENTGPQKAKEATHIKVVVTTHLDGELFADPRSHLWPLRAIEPAAFLDLAHDPLAFALLGQDPAETGVVGRTPDNEGPEKDVARNGARPKEEESDLGD